MAGEANVCYAFLPRSEWVIKNWMKILRCSAHGQPLFQRNIACFNWNYSEWSWSVEIMVFFAHKIMMYWNINVIKFFFLHINGWRMSCRGGRVGSPQFVFQFSFSIQGVRHLMNWKYNFSKKKDEVNDLLSTRPSFPFYFKILWISVLFLVFLHSASRELAIILQVKNSWIMFWDEKNVSH